MTDTTTVTVHLDRALGERLEALARETRRSGPALAAEAIAKYVQAEQTSIEAIKLGLAAADRSDLIPHERIEAWVKSWGTADELPPPDPE